MQKNRSNWKLRLIKLLNIILMISPFVFIWRLLYGTTERLVSEQTQYLLLLSVAALYILFGRIYDAFLLDVGRIHEIVYSQMLAAVVTDAFGFLILWMVMGSFPDFFKFILVIPLQLVFSTLWSLSAHRWYFRHFPPKRTLIIADSRTEALEFSRTGDFAKKFELVDILTTEELLEDPQEKLCGIEAIFSAHLLCMGCHAALRIPEHHSLSVAAGQRDHCQPCKIHHHVLYPSSENGWIQSKAVLYGSQAFDRFTDFRPGAVGAVTGHATGRCGDQAG